MTGCSLDMSISDLQSVGDGITPPKIELKIATDVDAGETVPLEISGGVPPYQYSVTGAATLDLTSNSLITIPSSNPTTATLIVTDAIGQKMTQIIPIRAAQLKYKAVEFPYSNDNFYIRDISFTPNGNILLAETSASWRLWRIDKLNANMASPPSFLDYFKPSTEYSTEPNYMLAVNESLYFNIGKSDVYFEDQYYTHTIIRRSTDSGQTWSTVYTTPVNESQEPKGIIKTVDGSLYLLVNSSISNTLILKSSDQGSTWSEVFSSKSDVANALHLADDNSTLFLGTSKEGRARLRTSTDQGQSWSSPFDAGMGDINDIATKGIGTANSLICWSGYKVGSQSVLDGHQWCSQDRGATWNGESFRITDQDTTGNWIEISSSGTIFSAGSTYDTERYLRKSTDFGATWTDVILPTGNFRPDKIVKDQNGHLFLIGTLGPSEVGLLKSTDSGQSWELWRHDYAVPKRSFGKNITTSLAGNLFSIGNLNDSAATIRKSTNQGETWSEYTFTGQHDGFNLTSLKAIGNSVFAASSNTTEATVWRSNDQGTTWQSLDTYSCGVGSASIFQEIVGLATGPIYAAGYCFYNGVGQGIIRRSTDNGDSWQTVDSYQLTTNQTTMWQNATIMPTGEVFVLGLGIDENLKSFYVIRRSADHGESWTTVETTLEPAEGHHYGASKLVVNADRVLFAGRAKIDGVPKMVVRQSTDKGVSWNNLLVKSEDSEWNAPEISTIYLDQNSVYLAYFKFKKSDNSFRLFIEKSRNFTDWYKIGEMDRTVVSDLSPCGSALCGLGHTDSLFGPEVWVDFKIE